MLTLRRPPRRAREAHLSFSVSRLRLKTPRELASAFGGAKFISHAVHLNADAFEFRADESGIMYIKSSRETYIIISRTSTRSIFFFFFLRDSLLDYILFERELLFSSITNGSRSTKNPKERICRKEKENGNESNRDSIISFI